MGYDDLTINERIERGFLSDTPEGKAQIRAAKVRNFFHDYEHWKGLSSDNGGDDGQEIQRLEHELGITEQEWVEYRSTRIEIEF